MQTANTVKQAIETVRNSGLPCKLEWYSLNKTNSDFVEYTKRENIDERALGVFVTGSLTNELHKSLVFMPIDWIDFSREIFNA